MNEPVILVDVMNLIFRAHFAHQNLSYEGKPTGVLYGALRIIHDLRTTVSKRIIFCWDHGIPVLGAQRPRNWREEVLPSYKATRKPNEAYKLVIPQLKELHRIIRYLGYSHVSVMGLEADDIIGVMSRSFNKHGVLVFSTDRDFYQLLKYQNVEVLVPKKDKGEFRRITQHDVEKDFGFSIERWAEYLALGGDSSDNIKPMRGMGPKTAVKIVQAGADLHKSFNQQSDDFRRDYVKFEPVWDAIQKSFHAARIPTDWKDSRIKSCLDQAGFTPYTFATISPDPIWSDEKAKADSEHSFNAFLSDHNMISLLSIRQQFFSSNPKREPQCLTQTNQKLKQPLVKRQSLI